jgi:hypothetical protein
MPSNGKKFYNFMGKLILELAGFKYEKRVSKKS